MAKSVGRNVCTCATGKAPFHQCVQTEIIFSFLLNFFLNLLASLQHDVPLMYILLCGDLHAISNNSRNRNPFLL